MPRYEQSKRDLVFTKDFIVQLRQTCRKHPGLYADVVHTLLVALLESEHHCRALEAENTALWRVLYNGKEKGQ